MLKRHRSMVIVSALGLCFALAHGTWLNNPHYPVQLRAGTELGFVKVLSHTIQLGRNGTMFDYVKEGGQQNLYKFTRLTAEVGINQRHNVAFLYQPLDLETQFSLPSAITVDTVIFPRGTAMDFRYFFDFYRLSYLYDFVSDPEKELSAGLSLQFRDASISFASRDGRLLRITQNVGPVPVIKLRAQWPIGQQSWIGAEVDGFYASSAFFNGAKFKFEGSIIDASVRYGLKFNESLQGFINWRYLGGSAKGQGYATAGLSDGYTDNRLGTGSVTLGFYIR